jgi:Fe-S-cluster-containing dehydrogenase component/anaerobic selenocysteine-containing dehydrogenase
VTNPTPSPDMAVDRDGALVADAPPGIPRRAFLRLLAATAAFAAAAGCAGEGGERAVPYARDDPVVVPGIPQFYATSMVLDGYATGLLVRSREGRPVKIEGNPDHPASLGAAGPHAQASILTLYDPHRARGMRRGTVPVGWPDVCQAFAQRNDAGAGLAFLLEPTSSPLRAALIARIRDRFPRARFHYYAPCAATAAHDGLRAAFGRTLIAHADFRRAERVVSFGADFTSAGPFALRYAREFAGRRTPAAPDADMSRLYQAETMPTPTGSLADHRLIARDGELPGLLLALVRALGVAADALPGRDDALPEPHRRWLTVAARDLAAHRGRSIIAVGAALPAAAHALAALANDALGNTGGTVWYTDSPLVEPRADTRALATFVDDLRSGGTDTAVLLDGNPAYTAPPDLAFADALRRVRTTLYLAPYDDETAALCVWQVAARHYLEGWGDARAYDGTVSFVQPLIEPFFDSRSADELLAVFAGEGPTDARRQLAAFWAERAPQYGAGRDVAAWWQAAIARGLLDGTSLPPITAAASPAAVADLAAALPPPARAAIEVAIRPDAKVYDGRFAHNAWLQELPDPVTKLTWGNAALLSPATAHRLGVGDEDLLEIAANDRAIRIPALVVPGHADEAVSLALGYGRQVAGGPGIGVDVTALRRSGAPFIVQGATVQRAPGGGHRALARTQRHRRLRDLPIVLEQTLDGFRADPDFTAEDRGPVDSLYAPPPRTAPEQWAMTIDLAACTGCSACVIACQAENNVPVVGADGVRAGREMHWLRIDQYLIGPDATARAVHQPMLCQHCEKAPCEYVCPVNATVHSSDGLNDMVYNRCVGTRFCQNNCPYKVRRFNWFDYNQRRSELETLVLNPEVTVRERGVMEKCTYCVQRLRRGQITARIAGEPIRDGVIQTACQQACPTGAIVFGSLTDPDSAVTRSRRNPRRYDVLHELGTQPRTQYLARLLNPDPDLPEVT